MAKNDFDFDFDFEDDYSANSGASYDSDYNDLDYSEFINAIPSSFSQNPCICIFDVNEKRTCVLIECDERSAKILRYFNPSAVDRDVLKKLNSNE